MKDEVVWREMSGRAGVPSTGGERLRHGFVNPAGGYHGGISVKPYVRLELYEKERKIKLAAL